MLQGESFLATFLLPMVALCPPFLMALEYHVTPTPLPNPACPMDKPCNTLAYYTSGNSTIFSEGQNVSLLFLDGYHEVDIVFIVEFSKVQSLTLTSANKLFNNGAPRAIIKINTLSVRSAALFKLENIAVTNSNLVSGSVTQLVSQNVHYQRVFFLMTSVSTEIVSIENSAFMNNSEVTARFNGYLPSITMDIINTVISSGSFVIRTEAVMFTVNVVNTTVDNLQDGLTFEAERHSNGIVTDSKFSNTGLRLSDPFPEESSGTLRLNITNTQFMGNGQLSFTTEGIVLVTGPATVAITNCSFENNIASVLVLTHVELYLQENVLFYNNNGVSGGAMVLTNSTMWLDKDSRVKFIKNTVLQVGGAIWLTQEPILNIYTTENGYPPCFYQLTFDITNPSDNKDFLGLVTFQDNSAVIGGDNMYGAALQSNCRMTPNRQTKSYQVFDSIFQFQNSLLSSVSSSPKRVCVCENTIPLCVVNNSGQDFSEPYYYNVTVTPGERFMLSLALVGNDFGLITGGVYALDRSGENVDFFFTPGDNLQQITALHCTDLEYSIHPQKNQTNYEIILGTDSISTATQRLKFQNPDVILNYNLAVRRHFFTNEITSIMLNTPVFIKLTILSCPLGTSLTNDTYNTCQCQPGLDSFAHNCLIINNTAVLYRNGTHWIGRAPESNFTLLTSSLCPLGYCNTEPLGVELDDQDAQCALNRTGVLCGGCPPGLSLAIGTSRCIQCNDNNGLALLLFFIIAGVVLVLCIKLLDITVAQGTINGLILYANIIWIHQGIYFPILINEEANQHFSNFYFFLKLFIAWLNLDFGIETCFIQGLNAYGKTWLQFVFPVYLWVLAILIIVCCSYSTRATKIFGNNTVTVLSTLFLLSYTKIQRTIVLIIAPAQLTQFNPGNTRLTWRLDSNLDYVGNPHVFLFILGAAAWILLCVPFTLALLCVKPLQKLHHCAPSARRSFIDSYTGPLKVNYRYWVGLTLLARGVLAITAGIFKGVNAEVAIDIVLISCALLCVFVLTVYRNFFLSLLDLVFTFNLVILSVVFLTTDAIETRVACTCISVAISFLLFVGIVVYHVYLIVHKHYNKINKQKQMLDKPVPQPSIDMPQTTTWIEMREELLETKLITPYN